MRDLGLKEKNIKRKKKNGKTRKKIELRNENKKLKEQKKAVVRKSHYYMHYSCASLQRILSDNAL